MSNESIIYGFLVNDEGFSPAGAAAALGNFDVETGGTFDPTSYNPAEGAIGEAQWELGRRTALQQYAAAHGGKETDLAMQLGYLDQELKHGYASVAGAMRSAVDPASAAATWDANFEKSAGTTRTQRVSNAQTIYQQITTGALTPSSSPATGSGGQNDAKGAPYNPSGLHAPLTKTQRTKIIGWLFVEKMNISGIPGNLTKLSDAQLIDAYTNAYHLASVMGGGITGPKIPGFSFQWVVNLVIKGAFTMAGLGMVVLGGYAAASANGVKVPLP